MIPNGESSGQRVILEIHHYLHDGASACQSAASSNAAELSGEIADKWVEMPVNKPRRVTRAMMRQINTPHNETPPFVRAFTKPTLHI